MEITRTSTRHLRQQRLLFNLLFLTIIGLLSYLSIQYEYLTDWTVNGQNSLNEVSLQLVEAMDSPVEIEDIVSEVALRSLVPGQSEMNRQDTKRH